ncbi:MAG: aromatic ring-hydroxylating dioxygenase subunit alpha [Roseovarius sp.]
MNRINKRPDFTLDRFSAEAETSYTLPAEMYHSKQTLEDEASAIFMRSWMYAAHISELAEPGQYVTLEILDQRLYVIRTKAGEIKAFFNVCQHRGHSLLHGKGQARGLIVCPYHAWSYDHDGKLQAAPNCTHVRDFSKDDFGIPEIRVDTMAGFIFVNLDPDARPIAESYPGAKDRILTLCPGAESLQTTPDIVFDIEGNWKNVGDNLLECYHCSPAHKAFVNLVEMTSYTVETHENWSIQWGSCRCENTAYDYDAESGSSEFCTLYLWPTTAIVKLPGTQGLAAFTFNPVAPEKTHQIFTYCAPHPDLDQTEIRAMEYFQDVLGPEDVDLIENVQKGLHSMGYHQGRFMVDKTRPHLSEHAVHHFQSLVGKALGMI